MHKLLVFDLDGTLAMPAKRMAECAYAQKDISNPIVPYIDYSFENIGEVLDFLLEKNKEL